MKVTFPVRRKAAVLVVILAVGVVSTAAGDPQETTVQAPGTTLLNCGQLTWAGFYDSPEPGTVWRQSTTTSGGATGGGCERST